ncbi:MAG: SUF system NifU family Fe-S cluster assembly protein [Planctomycetes bacterium]|nr:SUF system NifU family Fe-S cluster assembly protein [Planctomycetota bacterium]
MSDINDLYQELILDHNRRPRNFRRIEGAARMAVGYNPLCGDRVTVYVEVEGDVVKDVSFEGSGCAISTASASLMSESLKGKTVTQAVSLFKKFHGLLTGKAAEDDEGPALGKLKVFSGVGRFPARVKCATLVWHTFDAALRQKHEKVSTE